jgi:hypothetical protein
LLQGVNKQDAKAIVTARQAHGEEGLKRLAETKANKRADLLFRAVRNATGDAEDGSLFGALLHLRFNEAGLRAHLAKLMARLREMPIDGTSSSLLDALIPVAACHAAGIPGIDERVLADLLGVPRHQVHTKVIKRLGAESTAVRSAGHVLTRHVDVARAGLSLSDHLNPAPLKLDDIKLGCAGLGVAFGRLAGTDGDGAFALARRAAAWLGERTSPDEKALGYFKNHHRNADAIATPWPGDREQAIAWLRDGVRRAGLALEDPFLKGLAAPDETAFEQLDTILKRR